jgi:hypothetical protein
LREDLFSKTFGKVALDFCEFFIKREGFGSGFFRLSQIVTTLSTEFKLRGI